MTAPAPSETSPQPQPPQWPDSPPSRPSLRLGFRQPAEGLSDQIPSPAYSPETDQELPPDPFDAPGSGPEWTPESDESPDDAPSSSPGSSPARNPLVGKALRDTCRNGVIIAADQAHRFLATSPGQREAGLYRADTDDAANIGDPLSRIAARRQTLGEMNPDTADLLAAMMGLAGYATKQIQAAAIASKIDERRTPDNPQPLPGDQAGI